MLKPVIDTRRNVSGEHLRSLFDDTELWVDGYWYRGKPGQFAYASDARAKVVSMLIACPGCAKIIILSFGAEDKPRWDWDGNVKAPTLTPSIVHDPAKDGCGWHGFLSAGKFTSC